MLTRITRVKLVTFVVITVVVLSITALSYVRLPQQVGIGRYGVDVELAAASGLYPQAVVTYRGVEVGKVTDVTLRPGGKVVAELQIDNEVEIPADAVAEVRSASVIGEQYVNFVPQGTTDGAALEEGATVPVERTVLPTSTTELLTAVDSFFTSIPQQDLRTLMHEVRVATSGRGDELGRLIEDSKEFQAVATANLPATVGLLEDSAPVLRTQRDLDPAIRSFAGDMASFSTALAGADAQLTGTLDAGAPFLQHLGGWVDALRPHVPALVGDAAQLAEVLDVYRDNIEHLLIVGAAEVPTLTALVPPSSRGKERAPGNLWFRLGFDPPACSEGFAEAKNVRDPSDGRPAKVGLENWCKVPTRDPRAARGARNNPCPNGGRAASALLCGLDFRGGSLRRTGAVPPVGGSGTSFLGGAAAGFLALGSGSLPADLPTLLTKLVTP